MKSKGWVRSKGSRGSGAEFSTVFEPRKLPFLASRGKHLDFLLDLFLILLFVTVQMRVCGCLSAHGDDTEGESI